ncbi:MAG: hypothetical protein NT062_29435 [Proteobacteria bacterium]|nr:hypothetical protein [Pseudomonadota bacterium]
MRTHWFELVVVSSLLVGCSNLELDSPASVIHARFDPDAGIVPMPTDVLRDKALGRLNLPNDTAKERAKLDDAELEFYAYLETLDGWSSLMSATVELTGEIDPRSVTAESLQVWHWTGTPERVMDVRISVSADAKLVTIDPPRTGWRRGDQYVVAMRGGATGVSGKQGEKVECDAAFYFLRQTERLDTPEHAHAIPGDTREERAANTARLEGIREDLAPVFDFFEARQLPRADVAALWQFTVTTRTELAMDKASQRMPLPINLMLSPTTGHVDVPLAPWDSAVEAEAKPRLADFDGFGLSSAQMFELTAPVDPATVSETTVKLYRLDGDTPVAEPATVELLADRMHVVLRPKAGRLIERTSYVIGLSNAVRDASGDPIGARDHRSRRDARRVAVHDDVGEGAARRAARDGRDPGDRSRADERAAAVADAGAGGLPVRHRFDRERVRRLLRHDQVAGVPRQADARLARRRRARRRGARLHDDDPEERAEPDARRDLRARHRHRAPLRAGDRRCARAEGLRGDLDRLPVSRQAHVLRQGRPDLARQPADRIAAVAQPVLVGVDLQRRGALRRRVGAG